MAETPFKLKSGNTPLFKQMGSSPTKHIGTHPSPKDQHTHKGQKLFQRIHGALTGTEGKKFTETEVGKRIAKKKKDVVTQNIEKQLKTKKDADVIGTGKTLQVHKSSSGSGAIKPSGKNKEYQTVGGKGYMFTRGGGDPYQYRTLDEGETYQYKKVGETDWSEVRGGFDYIKSSYEKSKEN